ncbi:hypothetical protein M501DRAFT_1008096 [Patellaria atrata CBS 101060]|uniref:Exocyst complex component Sec3 PIP2-binding N-terminal domain-containing protein n=1 Tax=Patellaria atrata CBS 101060 TaxID=1346257 RepID=A0A9P4SGM1_9PEZI|nr:hypothetical protein M501DRAFT_1008096 [Patellaria atrata CBS 101060]
MDGPNGSRGRLLQPNGSAGNSSTSLNSSRPYGGSSITSPPSTVTPVTTRAEKFEDEKRRMIESCFSKLDNNGGSIYESYITHIRVIEDAAYPQTPPPPDSPPSNKKSRVIIVSVRNTGRVRVHKARENQNGTFSIGKTWNLEDLSALEVFNGPDPTQSEEEVRWREWGGELGFVVTLAKNYFWMASTAKEKEFFIASLVKIFKKYTMGRVPELRGFSQRDIDQMLQGPGTSTSSDRSGPPSANARSPQRRAAGLPGPGHQRPPFSPPSSPTPRNRPPTSGDDGPTPTSAPGQRFPQIPLSREPNRFPRTQPSREADLRHPPPSRDMQGPPSPYARPPGRLSPQSSRSELRPQRQPSPDASSVSSREPPPRRPQQSPRRRVYPPPGDEVDQMPSSTSDGSMLASSTTDRWRPVNGLPARPKREPSPSGSNLRPPTSHNERFRNQPPERKRPPMSDPQLGGSQRSLRSETASTNSDYPPPLASPRVRKQESPARSEHDGIADALTRQMPGAFSPPTTRPDTPSSLKITKSQSQQSHQSSDSAPPPVAQTIQPQENSRPISPPDTTVTTSDTPVSPIDLKKENEPKEEAPSKPGLGPMVKMAANKNIADTLRKAANAYGAFKPRAGGGAARFFASKEDPTKDNEEPNGITGVVPAPSLARSGSLEQAQSQTPDVPAPPKEEMQDEPKLSPVDTTAPDVPELKITSPVSARPTSVTLEDTSPQKRKQETEIPSKSPEKAPSTEVDLQEARKKRRRSNQHAKYLSALGVDPVLFEGRGLDFEATLSDFGWGTKVMEAKDISALEADIRREIGRVEAGSWLGHLEQKDDRVEAVEKMLDRAIAECDELEGLLTLYGVELSSLNEDVAYIEAQSQGLQVQTANQKLLQSELSTLVDTISITPRDLEPLKRSSLATKDGLESIEHSLLLLYKAMITIDPNIRGAEDQNKTSNANQGINELSSMRSLQEKRDIYSNESQLFLERLKVYMDHTFGAALFNTKDALAKYSATMSSTGKLRSEPHDVARNELWKYSPLLLFAKEISMPSWEALVKMYQVRAKPLYKEEFSDDTLAWKKQARKPTGEEQELLFTSQEKETEGMATTARKLTVKRSQTLAKSLRSGSSDKPGSRSKGEKGKLQHFESFTGALEEMSPLIFIEQNFIVDFFHASSGESIDFSDAVLAAAPGARKGTNLHARKLFETDRDMAKKVMEIMDDMFSFWAGDLQSMIEWALNADQLQGVGILFAMERTLINYEETNQDFITRTLQSLHNRLQGMFTRFVDDQIRAIEDTKVKIKKRKGVIAFIRIFPNFSAAIENMLPSDDLSYGIERLEIRSMVDKSYEKINKAMFESLRVIAKESPGVQAGVQAGGADPEDKEALNYHILLIENMNHYVEEVDDRNVPVLAEWKNKAIQEMEEHLGLYVDAVIRRPLGKLLDFLDTLTPLLTSLPPGTPASSLASRPTHTKSIFKKLLYATFDSKELRHDVQALKKRVDKHFGESDEGQISRELVAKVLKRCEERYHEVRERVVEVRERVYGGEGDEVGDVGAAWRR